MKIFLSYASNYRAVADDICCRLQAAGHEVFFDREDLPAGNSFDDHIRAAIESCALFIFLISPEAVADGRYTRTELKIVSRKWPTPGWHVLPVLVADTPLQDIPAYLRALNILRAEGNLPAEVVLEVQSLRQQDGETTAVPAKPAASNREQMTYRSMQLRFGCQPAGHYSLSLSNETAGDHVAADLQLNAGQLEEALWTNAQSIADSARRLTSDSELETLLPTAANVRQVGLSLFNALFESPLRDSLEQSMRDIDPQRGEGVRFVINTTAAPALARLPWEFLYSPGKDDFLFSDPMKPVVRWLDVDEPLPTLAVEPPLRLLLAIAAPTDRPGLAVGAEIAHLDGALSELSDSGQVEIVRLEHASLDSLANALKTIRPHILHFIGHGDFASDEGLLVLESDANPGASDAISGRQFAVLLRSHLTSLRLVFLNSCMGATAARTNPFGGVAQSLIRRGIPAVIAMQFPIPDGAAVALARHFYGYLAAGRPVDAALTSARAFLYARGYAVEWGAPTLHMRAPDGRLFDIAATADRPPAAIPKMAPFMAPGGPMQQPTSESLASSASPASTRRRLSWLPAVLGLLLLGAIGLWWQFSYQSNPEYGRPALPVSAPDDIQGSARDGGSSAVEQALTRLQAGDNAGATELLERALNQDASALSSEYLADQHAALATALADAAASAFQQDDRETAYRLLSMLGAMAPFDADLDAQIGAKISPWLNGMAAAAAAPDAAAWAETDRYYQVRKGDTLWAIARRLRGDGGQWPALLTYHNEKVDAGLGAKRIDDPARIYPGEKIWAPPSTAEPGTDAIDYHVGRGDTLWRIAARMYGDPSLWPVIYKDNASTIADPAMIFPGQILRISPRD